MDLSGLTSVTTKSQLTAWLTTNLVTPVTPAISASDLGTIMQKMIDILGTGAGGGLVVYDTHSANYTLALTDKAVDMNATGLNTLTIPKNADVAFPVGTQILIVQSGAGQTTVAGDTGVTIHSADAKVSLRTQYSWANLIKRDTDVWWLSGDLGETIVPEPILVKINLTNTSLPATESDWNNFNFDAFDTPLSLHTSTGDTTDWSIVASVGTPGTGDWVHITGVTFGKPDFPEDVLDTMWYLNHGTDFSLIISGLTVNQIYTVKTCTADSGGGDGPTKITVGNSNQLTADPNAIASELTFTNVTCDVNGNLLIKFESGAGGEYPLLNAFIISKI